MRLNGKYFEIYAIDTVSSIEKRIASRFRSLPKWLIYEKKPSSVSEYKESDVRAIDYLRTRVLNQSTLIVPSDFPSTVNLETVQNLFIGTNTTLSDDRNRSLLLYTIKNLYKDAESIWRDRNKSLGISEKEIKINLSESDKFQRVAENFEKIPEISFGNYEIFFRQFTLNLGKNISNLSVLFDRLVTSNFIPYAALARYDNKTLYKFRNGFEINPDWLNEELTDVLVLKINSCVGDKKRIYTNAAFAIQDDILYVTINLKVGSKFVDKSFTIKKILESFRSLNLKVESESDNRIVAYYDIPNQCFDPYVLAELTLNDPMFNSVIAIDEFLRPSKISSSIYLHRLETSFTLNMITKERITTINEWYIRCRISVDSIEDVIPFQIIIGKLMTLYNINSDKIIREYKRYIPSFVPHSCIVSKKKLSKPTTTKSGLRSLAPEIFFPTYTRKCANPPEIVNDDYESNVTNFMDFPIKGEIVNGKIVKTRRYACLENSHPFIGLRKNDLENRDIFPIVPCCFRKDQKYKPGSRYRDYYFGEEKPNVLRRNQQTESYKRRILDPGETESLPENLDKLFDIFDPEIKYVRKGVNYTLLSSIEAILLGKGQITYRGMRKSTLRNKVTKIADKLNSEEYAVAAKQELYDYEISDIINEIRTSDLRPSKFVRALELALDCNIFVFTSSDEDIGGSLLIPNHSSFYIKYRPNRETFLLYEHYGTDNDVRYPAVELITRVNENGFYPGDVVIKKLFDDVFRKLTQTFYYSINVPIFPPSLNVTSQLIDSKGKCRSIAIKKEYGTLFMVTPPLPPFAAVIAKNIYRSNDLNVVNKFLNEWKPIWRRKGEIGVVVGNVECALLVTENITDSNENNLYDDLDVPNAIINIGSTRKFSNILLQYVLKYAVNLLPIDKTNADEKLATIPFAANESAKYKLESDRFDSNPSFVDDSGSIIVSSDEIIKRLLFQTRMYALYKPEKILNLKNKDYIEDFYANTRDFIDDPVSIVVNGVESMKNVTRTYLNADYQVFSTIQRGTKPYFFRNKLISNVNIYLALISDSFENANDKVSSWTKYGYYDETIVTKTTDRPEVYGIVNENDIELLSGSDKEYEGCVLVFKINVNDIIENKFVALLKI